MNVKSAILSLVLLVTTVVTIGLSRKVEAQRVELDRLKPIVRQLAAMREENLTTKPPPIDPRELAALEREQIVLLKLRNVHHELLQSQGSATGPAARSREDLLREREELLAEAQQIQTVFHTAACIANLQQIDAAKKRWASGTSAEKGFPVTLEDLAGFFPAHTAPTCPAGGHYSPNRIGSSPVCSLPGHIIP